MPVSEALNRIGALYAIEAEITSAARIGRRERPLVEALRIWRQQAALRAYRLLRDQRRKASRDPDAIICERISAHQHNERTRLRFAMMTKVPSVPRAVAHGFSDR